MNANDAAYQLNPMSNIYTNTTNPQTIFARIQNGFDCYTIYPIALKVSNYTTAVPGIIKDVVINDFSGNSNSVSIQNTGAGPFEYSLDGTTFQSSPVFTNVQPGDYLVYTRDNLTCELSTMQIYVLDYPRFFTPNGDDINDFWMIKSLYLFPKATVSIFDRYGKLLKQLDATSRGWDGTFNGYNLPADDYWFHIKFTDSKTIKGHFSLKR